MIRFRNIKVGGFLTGKVADTGKDISLHIVILCYFILIIVTVRKKWSLHGMKSHPPVSGDCWWQLEKVDSECFYG